MKILLGTDGSRYALAAARFVAQHFANRGIKLDLVTVVPKLWVPPPPIRDEDTTARHRRTEPKWWLASTAERLTPRGITVKTHTRRGVPAHVMTQLAERGDYDLTVVGAKGRSNAPFFDLGSVALAVLEHAPTPVLVVRERDPKHRETHVPTELHPFRVLLATDGKPHSLRATRAFFGLFHEPHLDALVVTAPERPDAEVLERLAVSERERVVQQSERLARARVELAAERLRQHHVPVTARVLTGRPAPAVVAAACAEGADLIVLGSRGVRRPAERHLGSVALEIARAAPCSILVVRDAFEPR